jgi:peptide/nickel transport system substrate-binding protein
MNKYKKHIFYFVLLLLLVISGCSNTNTTSDKPSDTTTKPASTDDGEPKKGGEAVIAYEGDVSNYDPILGGPGTDHALLWPVYDTLVRFNNDLEPQPGLAKKWEIPDDKTIILYLQDGVKFHDGTSFDAEAVKFNLDRVKGEGSKVSDLRNVDSVEVIDPLTVKLHLTQPDASLILALSDRGGMMVSPTAIEKYGEDYSQHPTGAGPFKVVNRIPNGEVVLEAFEDYWETGKPYLDKLTIKIMTDENARINALKSGEVDFASNLKPVNVQVLEKDSNIVLKERTGESNVSFFVNNAMPPFDNKNVRLAIQYAINRDALAKSITFGRGEAAYQQFPKDYWAADKDLVIEYNPEKAKELLAESGLKNVSFKVVTAPTAYYTSTVQAVKAQLEEVGIEMVIEQMENTAAVTEYYTEKSAHAYMAAWSGRADPHMTLSALYAEGSFYNPGGGTTPEITKLFAEAAAIYDQEERGKRYAEINRIANVEEALEFPLFFTPIASAMNKQLKGYEHNFMGKPIFSTIWMEQ